MQLARGEHERNSALLVGPPGPGKTQMLSAMFQARFIHWGKTTDVVATHAPVIFEKHSALVTHDQFTTISNGEYKDNPAYLRTFDDLADIRLLLFDDLGTKGYTVSQLSRVEELFDARWRNNLPTWITTNINPKDMEDHPGWKRIYRRLKDKSKWVSVWNLLEPEEKK